jgi:hypothetical protein
LNGISATALIDSYAQEGFVDTDFVLHYERARQSLLDATATLNIIKGQAISEDGEHDIPMVFVTSKPTESVPPPSPPSPPLKHYVSLANSSRQDASATLMDTTTVMTRLEDGTLTCEDTIAVLFCFYYSGYGNGIVSCPQRP